jgi:hypothetical protein
MLMVQFIAYQKIEMISMRNFFMAAGVSVQMGRIVTGKIFDWCAPIWIFCRKFDRCAMNMTVTLVVHMSVVKIADVTVYFDGNMSASRSMIMIVFLV